jgi:pimeloyl-ACP methyl ester carboxylesterase
MSTPPFERAPVIVRRQPLRIDTRINRSLLSAAVPVKYFRVEGVATHVYHTGPTTLPEQVPALQTGETVLCLHHSGGNGSNFQGLFAALEGRHSPLAFDFPGHHRSGSLDSLGSIDRMAQFTGALIDKLGLESVVLLGHSMGGSVALELALARPQLVRGLVLCGAAARYPESAELLERYRLVTEGKARRHFDPGAYSSATSKEIVGAGFADSFKTDPRAVYPNLLALRAWEGESRLADVAAPTLIAVGADEDPHFLAQAEALADGIPSARQVTIERAGHMLPIERPDALGEAVCEFLEGST